MNKQMSLIAQTFAKTENLLKARIPLLFRFLKTEQGVHFGLVNEIWGAFERYVVVVSDTVTG